MDERIEIESLKWRINVLEALLLNFEGISRDSDGVLVFTRKSPLPAQSQEEGV